MYNSRASELAIYLRTYLHAAFHRSGMNSLGARSALVLHESHTVAATRIVWTAVILSSSETSGSLSNGRVQFRGVYNILRRSKGGFKRTPSNPPPCLRAWTAFHPSQNCSFVQRELKTQLKTRITRGDAARHLN